MQIAFDELKETLTSASCLALFDSNGEFEVTINTSENAKTVEAVVTQNHHSMIYESTKLNSHQLNYSIHDKKIYIIIHALEK